APPDLALAPLEGGEEPLQGRTLQRAAREAAVVIAVRDEQPAFGFLAGDIGLAGLALGVEAVELHLEALLGRLAGVDRAAELSDDKLLHGRLRWFFSPKKIQPFHREPAIARATAENDL